MAPGQSSSTPKRVVVVGSVNADLCVQLSRMPLSGETLNAGEFAVLPGGKGANQAACSARLGQPTTFIGQVGNDSYGAMLTSTLRGNGVDLEVAVVDLTATNGPGSAASFSAESTRMANEARRQAESALGDAEAAAKLAMDAANAAEREARAAETAPDREAAQMRGRAAKQAAMAAKAQGDAAAAARRAAAAASQMAQEASRKTVEAEEAAKAASMAAKGPKPPTGHAIVMQLPGGDSTIIIVGGANAMWERKHTVPAREGGGASFFSAATRSVIRQAGVLLLQREIPDEVNEEAARLAAAAGVPVVMDAGGMEGPLSPNLLRHVSVLSPNETELHRLTGMPAGTQADIERAAVALIQQGVQKLLIKLGAQGSLLASTSPLSPPSIPSSFPAVLSSSSLSALPLSLLHQPAVTAPQVVDTTGAGDTFTAAYAVAVLAGHTDGDALLHAACAASLCVRAKGAMPSLPARSAVDALLQEVRRS